MSRLFKQPSNREKNKSLVVLWLTQNAWNLDLTIWKHNKHSVPNALFLHTAEYLTKLYYVFSVHILYEHRHRDILVRSTIRAHLTIYIIRKILLRQMKEWLLQKSCKEITLIVGPTFNFPTLYMNFAELRTALLTLY